MQLLSTTRAVTEVTNAPERCFKTYTSTCLVFNVTLDMMVPINSKMQKEIKEEKLSYSKFKYENQQRAITPKV